VVLIEAKAPPIQRARTGSNPETSSGTAPRIASSVALSAGSTSILSVQRPKHAANGLLLGEGLVARFKLREMSFNSELLR